MSRLQHAALEQAVAEAATLGHALNNARAELARLRERLAAADATIRAMRHAIVREHPAKAWCTGCTAAREALATYECGTMEAL